MRNSCIISADLVCHGERNGCVIWDVIFNIISKINISPPVKFKTYTNRDIITTTAENRFFTNKIFYVIYYKHRTREQSI